MVVDYDGRILAQADPGPGEKVVVAPVDVGTLRRERSRRQGHDTRAHTRSGLYTYLQQDYLQPGGDTPPAIESLGERIRDAKRGLAIGDSD